MINTILIIAELLQFVLILGLIRAIRGLYKCFEEQDKVNKLTLNQFEFLSKSIVRLANHISGRGTE